jgi:hypothetical protein
MRGAHCFHKSQYVSEQKDSIMKHLFVISAALVGTLGVASSAPALASVDASASTLATAEIPWGISGQWEGTDPLDGGHATRTFTRNANGTVSLMGGDTHITLCGGGDDGTYSFSDGVIRGIMMTSQNFLVQCLPNGPGIRLLATYKMISRNQMKETLKRADDPTVVVTEVILTRVSD